MNSYVLIALGASLWGTTGIVARFIYEGGFSAFQLAILRSSIAFFGLLPFVFRGFADVRAVYRALPALAVYGVTTVGFYSIAFLLSLQLLPVAIAVSLMACSSILVTLLSRVFYQEPLTVNRVLALVAAGIGLPLVTGVFGGSATQALSRAGLGWGIAAAVAYAMYTLLGKSIVAKIEPKVFLAYNLLFGVLSMLLIDSMFIGSLASMPRLTAPVIGWLLLIGIGCHLLGWLSFIIGLRGVGPSRASLLLILEPLVATLLGWFVLREELTAVQGLGVVAILFGLALNSRGADIDRRAAIQESGEIQRSEA